MPKDREIAELQEAIEQYKPGPLAGLSDRALDIRVLKSAIERFKHLTKKNKENTRAFIIALQNYLSGNLSIQDLIDKKIVLTQENRGANLAEVSPSFILQHDNEESTDSMLSADLFFDDQTEDKIKQHKFKTATARRIHFGDHSRLSDDISAVLERFAQKTLQTNYDEVNDLETHKQALLACIDRAVARYEADFGPLNAEDFTEDEQAAARYAQIKKDVDAFRKKTSEFHMIDHEMPQHTIQRMKQEMIVAPLGFITAPKFGEYLQRELDKYARGEVHLGMSYGEETIEFQLADYLQAAIDRYQLHQEKPKEPPIITTLRKIQKKIKDGSPNSVDMATEIQVLGKKELTPTPVKNLIQQKFPSLFKIYSDPENLTNEIIDERISAIISEYNQAHAPSDHMQYTREILKQLKDNRLTEYGAVQAIMIGVTDESARDDTLRAISDYYRVQEKELAHALQHQQEARTLKNYLRRAIAKYIASQKGKLNSHRAADIVALEKMMLSAKDKDGLFRRITDHFTSKGYKQELSSKLRRYCKQALDQYVEAKRHHALAQEPQKPQVTPTEHTFRTTIHESSQQPGKRKKIMICVHGLLDHAESYQNLPRMAQEEGFEVISFDQRMFGFDRERRGGVLDTNQFRIDFRKFIEKVKADNPGADIALTVHSMSGAEALVEHDFIQQLGIQSVHLLNPAVIQLKFKPNVFQRMAYAYSALEILKRQAPDPRFRAQGLREQVNFLCAAYRLIPLMTEAYQALNKLTLPDGWNIYAGKSDGAVVAVDFPEHLKKLIHWVEHGTHLLEQGPRGMAIARAILDQTKQDFAHAHPEEHPPAPHA